MRRLECGLACPPILVTRRAAEEGAPHRSRWDSGQADTSSTPRNPVTGLQGERVPKEGEDLPAQEAPSLPEVQASPGAPGSPGTRCIELDECQSFSRKR